MIEEIKIDRLEELIQEMMRKIRDTYPTESREGNPITFDNGGAAPLVKCVTDIQGYQSGSGTPSSENIRPIVGYEKNDIVIVGKNLIPDGTNTSNGYIGESYIKEDGSITSLIAVEYVSEYFMVAPNTTYTASQNAGMNLAGFCFYDESYNFLIGYKFNLQNSVTVKTPANAKYCRCTQCYKSYTESQGYYVQFEIGSTASSYEPFTGTTYTTPFTSPIYKGSEDVVTGKVTAEWGYIASYDGETLPGLWISDRDEYAAGTTPTTGAQVAYELESPTTITETVSNAPVSSIHGYNYMESSTGEMEVTYVTEEFEALANVPAES